MQSKNIIVGVGIVLVNPFQNKIAILQEKLKDDAIGKEAGMWAIPQGHLELGESLVEAVHREIIEETGIESVEIAGVLGIYLIKGALGVVFVVETKQDVGLDIKDKDVKLARWIDPQELISGKISNYRPATKEIIGDYLKGIRYPMDLLTDCRE